MKRSGLKIKAFTLVEMLVAIALVALLAALIVPGIKTSLMKGQATRCLGHLRAISTGIAGYVADNGFYPGYRVTGEPVYWHQALVPYVDGNAVPKFSDPLLPWMTCPGRGDDRKEIGYGYNAYFGHVPPTASDYVEAFGVYWQLRATAVQSPSQKIIIGDNKDFGTAGSYSKYQISRSGNPNNANHPRRHSGGGNFLFADGHLEWLTPRELTDRSKATGGMIFQPF